MIRKRFRIILWISFFLGSLSLAQSQEKPPAPKCGMYVMIVSGINKDPDEKQAKDKAVMQLRKVFLQELHLEPACLQVFVDPNSSVENPSGVSRAAELEKALIGLASTITSHDRFLFYYVGQANKVTDQLRFNLRGPDITAKDLATWLGKIPSARQVVILDCPAAGTAIQDLVEDPNRILICGARSDQPYSTRFSEYFIPALIDPASNENQDGRISLLEAFQKAALQLAELYRRQDLLLTEIPLLEDDGDGIPSQQPWSFRDEKKDGQIASEFFFSSEAPMGGN